MKPLVKNAIPIVIEFVSGSRIGRGQSDQPFVLLPNGRKLSLPAEQLVLQEDEDGAARVGFGGMSFEGLSSDQFVFWRVRDLVPADWDSVSYSDRIVIDPELIAKIHLQGRQVWPTPSPGT